MTRRTFVATIGAIMARTSLAGPDGATVRAQGVLAAAAASHRKPLTLPAAPDALSVDVVSTALLVIDMQHDFASEGGAFAQASIDVGPIRQAVPPTARAIAAARDAGIPIIYLKMGFTPDLSNAGADDSANFLRHTALGLGRPLVAPSGRPSRYFIRDTWNTDIVPEVAPHPGDLVLYKHRFSGFYETALDAHLRRAGIRTLMVTGCTTSVCVESTIRDAMYRDYRCVLLADCTAEPIGNGFSRTNHDASLLTVETLLGWVTTSQAFIEAVSSAA